MLPADVAINAQAHVDIRREARRARCASCRIRRVLYRVGLNAFGATPTVTEARCATCWGIAPEATR